MDEKLKALYDSLSGKYDLGSFQEFSAKMQVPEKRRLLYDAASKDYDLGDYKTFESKVVKKKFLRKAQGLLLPTNLLPLLWAKALSLLLPKAMASR